MWAIGPRNRNNDYAFEHFERLVQSTKIAFDRAPTNNCGALMCSAAEVCPWKEEVIDARNKNATFVAEIGQSGGIRGYEGITGIFSIVVCLTLPSLHFPSVCTCYIRVHVWPM